MICHTLVLLLTLALMLTLVSALATAAAAPHSFGAAGVSASASLATRSAAIHCSQLGGRPQRSVAKTKQAAFDAAFAVRQSLPTVVLARPFDPGNIGSAARAMMNFGLCELRLVSPASGLQWRTAEAEARACGALRVLDNAAVFGELTEATADLGLVLATTARPRDCSLPVLNPREAAELAARTAGDGSRVAFLFGSEKNGLSADELKVAHAIVTVPTDPLFSSLNLAQAVLLLAYEWGAASIGSSTARPAPAPKKATARSELPATGGQLEALFGFWEEALWSTRFFGSAGRGEQAAMRAASTMAKLRAMVMRMRPSNGEVSLLHGALSTLLRPKSGQPGGTRTAQAAHDARGDGGCASAGK